MLRRVQNPASLPTLRPFVSLARFKLNSALPRSQNKRFWLRGHLGGAVADVFDDSKANWASEREELKSLLSEKEYDQARRTILNAHYTSPAITSAIWDGLQQLGFTEGRVLEPGCGSGNFMGVAPDRVEMTGIELDPLTAAIAQGLYPDTDVRAESFSETLIRPGQFDAYVAGGPRRMASLTFQINGTDLPFCQTKFKVQELLDSDKARMVPQLERLVRSLEDRPPKLEAAIKQHSKTIEQYEPQAKKTFEEKETLEAKKAALADVLKRIEGNQTVKAEAQTHETVAAAGTVAKETGETSMPHQTSESNGATRRLMSMNGAPRGQTHVHKPQDTPAHNWDAPTQKNHRGPER